MSHDLAATLDPHGPSAKAWPATSRLVAHAEACVLSTWDREGDRVVTFGTFTARGPWGLEPEYQSRTTRRTRRVLVGAPPYVVNVDDPAADRAEVDYLRAIGHRTLVMLPLVVRDESIGIVELSSTRPNAFGERDVELAELLVREAAVTFENARLTEELRQLAYRDPLTGLANRSRLQDRVDHALARLRGRSPNRAAVLFIDLDHFNLNDRFGHAKGDRALKAIAERIKSIIRPVTPPAASAATSSRSCSRTSNRSRRAGGCDRLLTGLGLPIDLDDAAPIIARASATR